MKSYFNALEASLYTLDPDVRYLERNGTRIAVNPNTGGWAKVSSAEMARLHRPESIDEEMGQEAYEAGLVRRNNDCIHCVAADKKRVEDLPTRAVKGEIDHYSRVADLEHSELVLTGGEPTIRTDLPQIVSYARSTGFRALLIQTNGRAIDGSFAVVLAESGLTRALVAVHGPEKRIHESITRAPGSFAETMSGIAHLLSAGITVRTQTVISRLNLRSLPRLVDLLARTFPQLQAIQVVFPHPIGNAGAHFDRVVPRLSEIAEHVAPGPQIAAQAGIEFSISDVPFCLLPDGIMEFNADLWKLDAMGTDPSLSGDGRVESYSRLMAGRERVKGEACRWCSLERACRGIWVQYADKYTTAELEPVTGITPADLASRRDALTAFLRMVRMRGSGHCDRHTRAPCQQGG